MEDNFTNLELMEQFHLGHLDPEEQQAFETKLENDDDFRAEFEIFQELTLGIQEYNLDKTRDIVSKVHQGLKQEQFFDSKKTVKMDTHKKTRPASFYAIAAAVALLVCAGAYFLLSESSPASSELYAKFYKPETTILNKTMDKLTALGMGDPEAGRKDTLSQALTLYERGKYEEARADLASYLDLYPQDDLARMYLGLSLLQQSEYAKASVHLEPLANNPEFEYAATAKWYLALAYTQFNIDQSRLDAIKIFEQLHETGGNYSDEAKIYLSLYK